MRAPLLVMMIAVSALAAVLSAGTAKSASIELSCGTGSRAFDLPLAVLDKGTQAALLRKCADGSDFVVSLQGGIDKATAAVLVPLANRMMKLKPSKPTGPWATFLLDSEGGDVRAALAIGRAVRRLEGTVIVQGRCLSACVFIYAGGVMRFSAGRIGVHRAFFVDLPEGIPADEVDRRYRAIQASASMYLDEMHVSPALLDLMISVPPEQIKMLSLAEQERYGLGPVDPVYDERITAFAAHDYGITSQEYRRRSALADQVCGKVADAAAHCGGDSPCFHRFKACYDSILDGSAGR